MSTSHDDEHDLPDEDYRSIYGPAALRARYIQILDALERRLDAHIHHMKQVNKADRNEPPYSTSSPTP